MRIIDLTQEIFTGMQVFPLHSPTMILPWARREVYGFETEALFINSHGGTHIDAPHHFLNDGKTIDSLPLVSFLTPGIIFDFSWKGFKGYIAVQDIQGAEKGCPIQPGDTVIFYTGIERYLGKSEFLTSYSGLSQDAGEYLVERKIASVGVDAPSIDHPDDASNPAHRTLLSRGILIIENLYHLGNLINVVGAARFQFVGLPLKIRGANGSPIRAVAIVEENEESQGKDSSNYC
jgi:kynurenine formamidase